MSSFYNPSKVTLGGITDVAEAKEVAKMLFEAYDRNRDSQIDGNEISLMMIDAYRALNKGFNPSKADIDTYSHILDWNSDGKVTIQDMEAVAIKYLVGTDHGEKKDIYEIKKIDEQKIDQVVDAVFKKMNPDENGDISSKLVISLFEQSYALLEIKTTRIPDNLIMNWMNEDTSAGEKINKRQVKSLLLRCLKLQGLSS